MERSVQEASETRKLHRSPAHLLGSVITCVVLLAGCHTFDFPDRQILPTAGTSYTAQLPVVPPETLQAARAELEAARIADADGQEQCLDLYCQAATAQWRQLQWGEQAALPTYRESLARMLAAANRFGRLDPRSRLTLSRAQREPDGSDNLFMALPGSRPTFANCFRRPISLAATSGIITTHRASASR